jgi:hypothetical protein
MSAGVAERPLDGIDLSISGCVRSSSDGFWGTLLAQAIAAELQAMGVVDDAVEDGVGEGRFADQVVPFVDRDLAGDQRGAAAVAVFTISSMSWRCSGPSALRPQSSRINSLTPPSARISRG